MYKNLIPGIAFEKEVILALSRYLEVQNHAIVPLPIFIAISLLRIKGFRMSNYVHETSEPIDRNTLLLPEVLVEDYGTNIGRLLRPSFDALWQACGLEKSLNYDDAGDWRQHHQ